MTWCLRELDLGKPKTKKQNKVRTGCVDTLGKDAEAAEKETKKK